MTVWFSKKKKTNKIFCTRNFIYNSVAIELSILYVAKLNYFVITFWILPFLKDVNSWQIGMLCIDKHAHVSLKSFTNVKKQKGKQKSLLYSTGHQLAYYKKKDFLVPQIPFNKGEQFSGLCFADEDWLTSIRGGCQV